MYLTERAAVQLCSAEATDAANRALLYEVLPVVGRLVQDTQVRPPRGACVVVAVCVVWVLRAL